MKKLNINKETITVLNEKSEITGGATVGLKTWTEAGPTMCIICVVNKNTVACGNVK